MNTPVVQMRYMYIPQCNIGASGPYFIACDHAGKKAYSRIQNSSTSLLYPITQRGVYNTFLNMSQYTVQHIKHCRSTLYVFCSGVPPSQTLLQIKSTKNPKICSPCISNVHKHLSHSNSASEG